MIDLFSGTPGSGKSLHAAEKIYDRLHFFKPVITNFPVNLDRVPGPVGHKGARFPLWVKENDKLTPEWLIDFSRKWFWDETPKEDSILLVIDEAQMIFNSRDWSVQGRKDWLSFFTQHRKFGYQVILIAQFDEMLDKQIRPVIEYEYIHRKLTNFGIKGFFLAFVMGGANHVCVKVWYPMKEKVGQEFFRPKRRYYSMYDTYKHFSV